MFHNSVLVSCNVQYVPVLEQLLLSTVNSAVCKCRDIQVSSRKFMNLLVCENDVCNALILCKLSVTCSNEINANDEMGWLYFPNRAIERNSDRSNIYDTKQNLC